MHDDSPAWAVLSDMDGTLLDTERTWLLVIERFVTERSPAVPSAPAAVAVSVADIVAAAEGLDLVGAATLLHTRLRLPEPIAEVAADLDRRSLEAYSHDVTWRPGAERLLHALSAAEVPVALVTSSPRHWVDRFALSVDLSSFRATVTADDATRLKPAPDPYLQAAAALGLPARHCIALEDSLVGATAALAAGCTTVVIGDSTRARPGGVHAVRSMLDLDVRMLRDLVPDATVSSSAS
ncbi:HAD family phosphatase [Microbacterium sp. C5A9]|uniref:HAD family hydrolase n=1 Tax=Microbacterium sp. C5A9 TaxID=2736663 RepID=UPI001F515D2C|nr:HAD family phosphatase [Microbacterium sp. C5A9]MCI1019106.1 HAD family phosphatase [Microbacterium sp. C5A9]